MNSRQPDRVADPLSTAFKGADKPTIENPSYQLQKPFVLTEGICKAIDAAFDRLDQEQIRILRTKSIAERVQIAVSMIDAVETVGSYRLRQREPELSELEALHIVRRGLTNYYRQKNATHE